MRSFRIGHDEVGTGDRTYIVVELGVTHGNDLDLARHIIRTAKEAGANAVKCEAINPDALVAASHRDTLMYSYGVLSGEEITVKYYELLKSVAMPLSDIATLKRYADEIRMPFFGTAFDIESVEFLDSIGSCAIKLSSPDIVHFPLIEKAARTGRPLLLDTGRATLAEIGAGVRHAREAGCRDIVLMHNPSGYPAPFSEVHLRMIQTMRATFDIPVGHSCHNRGMAVCFSAVGMGADVIEKPVSRDNTQPGDEHIFSLNVEEIGSFVETIRQLDLTKGLSNRDARLLSETEHVRSTFRQSLVAARDLFAGQRLERNDVAFSRPGWGIPAAMVMHAIGARLRRNVSAGDLIEWTDLQELSGESASTHDRK